MGGESKGIAAWPPAQDRAPFFAVGSSQPARRRRISRSSRRSPTSSRSA